MVEKLTFYDLKNRKKFTTEAYKVVTKNGRKMAVAKAPSGITATRFM